MELRNSGGQSLATLTDRVEAQERTEQGLRFYLDADEISPQPRSRQARCLGGAGPRPAEPCCPAAADEGCRSGAARSIVRDPAAVRDVWAAALDAGCRGC